MLEWFTENAFFPSSIGILLTITFIGLAMSSGEMLMMKIGLGIALLTALLVTTEILIVTDREQVENSLYDMASSMRQNDFDGVFEYLDTPELIARAKKHLQGATCHACNITAINEVAVDDNGTSATADFAAFARASDTGHPSPVPMQQRIKLFFIKRDGDWKVSEFELSDPRSGFKL